MIPDPGPAIVAFIVARLVKLDGVGGYLTIWIIQPVSKIVSD